MSKPKTSKRGLVLAYFSFEPLVDIEATLADVQDLVRARRAVDRPKPSTSERKPRTPKVVAPSTSDKPPAKSATVKPGTVIPISSSATEDVKLGWRHLTTPCAIVGCDRDKAPSHWTTKAPPVGQGSLTRTFPPDSAAKANDPTLKDAS